MRVKSRFIVFAFWIAILRKKTQKRNILQLKTINVVEKRRKTFDYLWILYYFCIVIFYFSCTGNTLWAAQQIGAATGDTLTDMASVSEAPIHYRAKAGERIGFCFPVHGWRPPVAVRDFIRRLRVECEGTPYCWVLCTAGDDIGETIEIFAKDLRPAGLTIDSAFSLAMPESYVGLPFMDVDPPARELQKLSQARADLQGYIDSIICLRRGERHLHLSRWPRTNSRLLGALFVRCLLSDRPFRVDAERCIRCGRCAKACPVGNILQESHDTPAWQHTGRCLSCFACYHHCPVRAIEYGRRTHGKGQYYFGKSNVEHKTPKI